MGVNEEGANVIIWAQTDFYARLVNTNSVGKRKHVGTAELVVSRGKKLRDKKFCIPCAVLALRGRRQECAHPAKDNENRYRGHYPRTTNRPPCTLRSISIDRSVFSTNASLEEDMFESPMKTETLNSLKHWVMSRS